MVWSEQSNVVDDCYFCLIKTSGYSKKTQQKLSYPNLDSAIHPNSAIRTHMKYQYLLSQNCIHWKIRMNQMKIMGMPEIQTL